MSDFCMLIKSLVTQVFDNLFQYHLSKWVLSHPNQRCVPLTSLYKDSLYEFPIKKLESVLLLEAKICYKPSEERSNLMAKIALKIAGHLQTFVETDFLAFENNLKDLKLHTDMSH